MILAQPDCSDLIEEKLAEIIENWENLIQSADERKNMLEESRAFHHFLADLRDLVMKHDELCYSLLVLISVVVYVVVYSWDGCMISTRRTLLRSLPGVWLRLSIF